MDLRRFTGVQFVSKAPSRGGGEVALRVSKMEPSHVLWWHSHVQPVIDRDPKRVDNDWNWMLFSPLTRLFGLAIAKRPVGYTLGIVAEDTQQYIPCALVLLLGRDRAFDNHNKRSTFTWYLSTAPDEALLSIKDYRLEQSQLPKRLGSIALGISVTHSLNHVARGRVSLHSDVGGGEHYWAGIKNVVCRYCPRVSACHAVPGDCSSPAMDTTVITCSTRPPGRATNWMRCVKES